MKTTEVVIADTHPVFRDGLAAALDRHHALKTVATAGTGDEALAEVRRLRPDVLVIDLDLPGLRGIAVLRSIAADSLPTACLAISSAVDRNLIYDAISAGARSYLSKVENSETLCEAVAAVAAGRTYWPPEIQELLAHEIRGRGTGAEGAELSPREVEILKLVADGLSTSEIAGRIHLSAATVKTHLHRSFGKLGVNDRAAAVAEALRRRLFS